MIVAVLPTRNEAENVGSLTADLRARGYAVVVVDDASTDATRPIVAAMAARDPHVVLIERPGKMGRGSAIRDGFAEGLLRWPEASAFVEMDADRSHDPDDIARLAQTQAVTGADAVVACRYMEGGGVSGWPLRRRAWSAFSNLIIRLLLWLPVPDATNGYRLYTRATARFLVGFGARETGYITLSESIDAIRRAGGAITGIPSHFKNRTEGTSKTGPAEAINALRGVLRIRFRPVAVRPLTTEEPR